MYTSVDIRRRNTGDMPNPVLSARGPDDQDFMFVSVTGLKSNNQASRGEVRKHVAKQHFRRKRLQDIKKFQAASSTGWQEPNSPPRPDSRSSTEYSGQNRAVGIRSVSPRTVLSASQSDPFNCYPVAMRHEDFELIEFCECAGSSTSAALNETLLTSPSSRGKGPGQTMGPHTRWRLCSNAGPLPRSSR